MKTTVTYLGIACVHVCFETPKKSVSVLVDPCLNEVYFAKRMGVKGIEELSSFKQLKVFQEPVSEKQVGLALEGLQPPDIVLITHGHTDHMAHAADVAKLTGATVVGARQVLGRSVRMGLKLSDTQDIRPNEEMDLGPIWLETYAERHNPNALSDMCQRLLNLTPADSEHGHMGFRFGVKNGPAVFHAGDGSRPEGFPTEPTDLVMLSVDAARGACPEHLSHVLQGYGDETRFLSMHRFYDAPKQNAFLEKTFGERALIPPVGGSISF